MVDAAFAPLDLRRAGWSARDLRNGGLGPGVLKRCGFSLTELKQAGFSNAACHQSAQAMRGMIDEVPKFDERRYHRAPKLPDSFTPRIRFFTDQEEKVSKGLVARDRFVAAGQRISMINANKAGGMNMMQLIRTATAVNQAKKTADALTAAERLKAAASEVKTSIGPVKEVVI
jgi:hypothetical protein